MELGFRANVTFRAKPPLTLVIVRTPTLVVLKYSALLLLFGFFQPLGHLFVICSVTRPALRSTIPAVVFDGHINAAVDEELHRLIVSVPDEFVQDACWLMRTPSRVDVC